MQLIVIFGPAAVGKMSVGLELQRLSGLRLFHNHMSVDLALKFFPFGSAPFARLVKTIRNQVFEEVAASDLPGLVFTYVWALNDPRDKESVDKLTRIFTDRGATVGYVELFATQEERERRLAMRRSVIEKVMDSKEKVKSGLGKVDRSKIDEYLTSVREVEQQVEKAEKDGMVIDPGMEKPFGVPPDFGDYYKLMTDMLFIAFQADLTRVATVMLGRELSNLPYP